MEIGSVSHEKAGCFTNGLMWFMSLPGKLFAKLVEIAKQTKKIGKDDPRRVIHSLKVGLALTLVSLFYYFQPLYNSFGVSAMWAIMTVVVVFEFSVGKFYNIFFVLFYMTLFDFYIHTNIILNL